MTAPTYAVFLHAVHGENTLSDNNVN